MCALDLTCLVNVPFPAVKCCRARKLHAMPLIKISIASTAASATIMLLTFNCIIPLNSIKSHQVKRGADNEKKVHICQEISLGVARAVSQNFKKRARFETITSGNEIMRNLFEHA